MAKDTHASAYWERMRHECQEKSEIIFSMPGYFYCGSDEFYRALFPEGFLQAKGEANSDGRPNAIALEIRGAETDEDTGKSRNVVRRYTITDGLSELPKIRESSIEGNTFVFLSPVSYFGKNRTARNARFLHAFAIDLDGVGPLQLRRVLHWMEQGQLHTRFPQANYIVNSGTGVHLYYVLDRPIPLIPRNVPGLQLLKTKLIERLWTEDTSEIDPKERQYQGIYQGFRMVGTSTKLNGAIGSPKTANPYEAVAFHYPAQPPATIDYLLSFVPDIGKNSELEQVRKMMETAGKTPIEEARSKWPEWYERRIERGEERGCYLVKRDLYDWWLRQVRQGYTLHHRYWCVFALASYANKCGIGREELEEDAFSLLPLFKTKDEPGNEFSAEDVLAALDAFEDGSGQGRARRYTKRFLSSKTAIPMREVKRNNRKQGIHLQGARAILDINYPDGAWRNKGGAPTKRDMIREYAFEHPEANHSEIARALGVSRPTVIKWLKGDWRNEWLHTASPVPIPKGMERLYAPETRAAIHAGAEPIGLRPKDFTKALMGTLDDPSTPVQSFILVRESDEQKWQDEDGG